MIKPMLARGELRMIGATTLDEYRKHIEKDGALERRFQSVNVEAQQTNERSLWWWMKRTIALRRRHPVFCRGDIQFLQVLL